MINRTKQDWTIGQTVKVGFMTLTVRGAIKTPGDFKPDAYMLTNAAQNKFYRFVPHNGCQAIDASEFRQSMTMSA